MIKDIKVGTILRLSRPCLGNDIGTTGVCYWVYDGGYCFIFPNGNYDGFGTIDGEVNEVELCFHPDSQGFEPSVSGYEFTNVTKLSRDFSAGYFRGVWGKVYKGFNHF